MIVDFILRLEGSGGVIRLGWEPEARRWYLSKTVQACGDAQRVGRVVLDDADAQRIAQAVRLHHALELEGEE